MTDATSVSYRFLLQTSYPAAADVEGNGYAILFFLENDPLLRGPYSSW